MVTFTAPNAHICSRELLNFLSTNQVLLGGYAPFQARNPDDRDELFKVIKRGKLVFHERYWKTTSADAKDLITQMLTMDPDARPSADQLLSHQWIGRAKAALSKNSLEESKRRLKDFNAKRMSWTYSLKSSTVYPSLPSVALGL
jgi:serine/threonine protein kinase